ncbi:MAG: VanZ family protein [Romboutsia sp.]|uniref:VanZ family protein n=1 Tax=Romboutsia sp. TaxID=1965302 RepID=UPI003F33F466
MTLLQTQTTETINTCYFLALLLIISLTLFPIKLTNKGLYKLSLIPFRTIISFILKGNIIDILANIIGNTLMFIPLGFFSYIKHPSNKTKSIKICLFTTLFVETTQIFLPARLFDVDDLMLNFLGGYIGIYLAILFIKILNKQNRCYF